MIQRMKGGSSHLNIFSFYFICDLMDVKQQIRWSRLLIQRCLWIVISGSGSRRLGVEKEWSRRSWHHLPDPLAVCAERRPDADGKRGENAVNELKVCPCDPSEGVCGVCGQIWAAGAGLEQMPSQGDLVLRTHETWGPFGEVRVSLLNPQNEVRNACHGEY